ncbi:MAG TPA: tetratricopeptide repeat protein [Bryobacteraceae bacterium]|nr:tetratricopeptide repeat protein [Bryobacteraceae bacterium]
MWTGVAVLFLLFAPAADYQAEGLKALEAKQYDQAAQFFTQAVSADPKDYAAHFHLALAYSLLGKDAEAIPEYQKTLDLKPGLYQAELNLGMLLVRTKRDTEAVPHLEAAVQSKPAEFRPQWLLAEALLASGDFAKAEQHYQAAAAIDPKSAPAQLGLGRALARQNRLAEAAGHFRNAAELDQSFNDALLELAGLYEQNHQPENAIAIYQKFPANVAAQEHLGELLIEANRFAEAIPCLETAVAHDPTAANRLALSTAYRMNKEPEKALSELKKAVAAEPQSYDLHMDYGRALRDQRQFIPAANQFAAAAQRQPDSREAWNELAGVLTLADQYPQALAALDHVKALGKEIPGDYYLRAIILDKLHQYKPALESYRQFLAASNGKNPDEEFKARQRSRIIERILSKR